MSEPLSPASTDADSDKSSSIALNLTLTEQYCGEPFEEFEPKAKKLCESIWPDAKRIELERIPGGSCHRIVAIKVLPEAIDIKTATSIWRKIKGQEKQPRYQTGFDNYILRIPRFPDPPEELTLHHERVACEFAEQLLTFPVPKTVKVCLVSENSIGNPYVIQERMTGQPLDDLWKTLNQQQRLCAAKLLGKILRELAATTAPAAGKIDPRDPTRILAPPLPSHPVRPNMTELAQPMKPAELLRNRLAAWTENHARHEPYFPYAELAKLIKDDTLGPDDNYYFCHGDLYPRNILAEVVDQRRIKITGIIDWDLAAFAPAFVAFEAPCWLWKMEMYETGELEDEKLRIGAADEPVRDEDRQLKAAFEETVGDDWLRIAYWKDVEVLRWIWRIGMEGLGNSTYWRMADAAIEALSGRAFGREWGRGGTKTLKSGSGTKASRI
ncbi:hypothetical protein, variant [Verruconis gallopava]|uniref:Aminoglycoside phosphotransferase domain-containing protein n=1 Tax=Verruconis gallopava TaxID=253628 RepID=A0A0D2A019_9PEZI|nr:hypothetical protein, variant [Verruconis gallopava]KIV99649.1 hypothetical protein, variant [Verruconis gallopava]